MKKRFFSHDENALSDPKIMSMMSVYGFEGYGRFWALVELLRREDSYKINMTKKTFYHSIAHYLRSDIEQTKEFLNDCIFEFELFQSDGESFWSESLNNRMKMMEQKTEARTNAALSRWSKKQAEQPQEAVEVIEAEQDKPKRERPVRTKNATVAQYSDDVIFLTDLLIQKMKVNNPNVNDPNLNNWRENIRLMMDNDGYTFDQVKRMIEFSQTDDFWKSNILSTKKLRDKAGTLVIQMNREVSSAKHWSENRKPIAPPSRFAGINETCTIICADDDEPEAERIEQIRAKAAEYDGVRLRTVP